VPTLTRAALPGQETVTSAAAAGQKQPHSQDQQPPEEEEEEEEEGLHGVFKRLRRNGQPPYEEEEGLQGVFKQLRRNGHQLEKGSANGSARAVTQVRPNHGKMVSVGKFWHMAMVRAQPPSSLHAIRPHNLR
jgi:hypothetical protein